MNWNGLTFGSGLRRSESAAVWLEDFDPERGAIREIGTKNRERFVYDSWDAKYL